MLHSFVSRCAKCIRCANDEGLDVSIDCFFDPGDIPFTIYLESGLILYRVYHDSCDHQMGPDFMIDLKHTVCTFCSEKNPKDIYIVNLNDIVAVCRHG